MMQEQEIVRGMLLRIGRDVPGTSPLAKAVLAWARPHARWLLGAGSGKTRLSWRDLRVQPVRGVAPADPARPLEVAAQLAEALRFDAAETRVLVTAVAIERSPRARALGAVLAEQEYDLSQMLAELAGIEPHALRRSQPLRLGLVRLYTRRGGGVEIEIGWTVDRLIERPATDAEGLLEIAVGPRQRARLEPNDFIGRDADIGFLIRLLAGAVHARAVGVNILIHGPPGTGKTELARTLAAAAGVPLYSVGEADEDGDEPTRWDRVNALSLAHRMLAERGGASLLFDEMEDLIGDVQPGQGDWMRGRQGSKLWINRLIETNPVPVVWTTNAIGNLDPAIVRRMSYVLHLGAPSHAAGIGMLDRIGREEGIAFPEAVRTLVGAVPEAASVLRVAARAGQLAGEPEDIGRAAQSLVLALRRGAPVPVTDGDVDLSLFEADRDIAGLFASVAAPGAPADISLLLTGPPGTGKTGLAHHLARALDRPLLVKRASDLLSKWVGETEQQIADAFREAERREAVLLFDEVDSLLFDRGTATQTWQVGQVNELLSWLDRHPLPFVAATNHVERLDPAALRRFVFKLELGPLGPARAAAAWQRFFGIPAPAALTEIANLTPGDFAVVRRQLRFTGGDQAFILARLRAEVEAKPGRAGRLGF